MQGLKSEKIKSLTVSTTELKEALKLTARQISKLSQDGILCKVKRGQYNLLESIQNYISYLSSKVDTKNEVNNFVLFTEIMDTYNVSRQNLRTMVKNGLQSEKRGKHIYINELQLIEILKLEEDLKYYRREKIKQELYFKDLDKVDKVKEIKDQENEKFWFLLEEMFGGMPDWVNILKLTEQQKVEWNRLLRETADRIEQCQQQIKSQAS